MMLNGKRFAIFLMVLVAIVQSAYCIQITATGGDNSRTGSVSMNFETLKSTSVSGQIAINGATITPSAAISGSIPKFEQTHAVKDISGKKASVYVKVINAPNGLTYTSKVLPKEGSVATQTQVSAEQWLTVPKADSILCTATASYGSLSAGVGLMETKGTATGDYVTLTGYDGKAVATSTLVTASQTATSGAANSITINGSAKYSSGSYNVNTPLKGTFTGLSETASAGTTTQVAQKEHVHGTFTSTAISWPTTGTPLSKSRTSDYGIDYDLIMKVVKGSLPTGTLGYYVKPGTSASKIQGAVTAAQSGDTVNVAAGTYKENVIIDKSLKINGADHFDTIVDGQKLGSVFKIGTVNSNVDVILSGLGITGGSAVAGGGIFNKGRATIKNCLVFTNYAWAGGAIQNMGTATVSGSTITGNTAEYYGGGIDNAGTAATTLTVTGSTISGNSVKWINGGSGGGIHNKGTATVSDSTIFENSANVGGGIYNQYGTATVSGSTISGNSAQYGGGIINLGTASALATATISGSTISGNSAIVDGGGIYNVGPSAKLTVTGSTISGNSAQYGGGIINLGTASAPATATISGSTISGNSAKQSGGGIYNTGTATVSASIISGNTAEYYGGGIYNTGTAPATATISGSTISGNSAKQSGGGILNLGTTVIKKGSYIFLNIADSDGNGTGNGGGIYEQAGGSLVFLDQSGNPITNPDVINSIVFYNHLKSNTGSLNNIAP